MKIENSVDLRGGKSVSNSAHVGPKHLAATRRLLLANPRRLRTSRGQENKNNLDAARIRTNPMALPGLLAGVRPGRGHIAGDCFREARIREAQSHKRHGETRSLTGKRAPLAFTPHAQPCLYARFSAHPKLAVRHHANKFSAACVSISKRAEAPKANSAQDGGPARNRARP